MMMDGVGGTAAVLTRETSFDTARATGINRRDPGRGSETASGCQAAVETTERLGAGDLHLASSLHQMAKLCRERGGDRQARPRPQRAPGVPEPTLGPAHPPR